MPTASQTNPFYQCQYSFLIKQHIYFTANCCPTLRLTSTNEDTNTYWGPKLGVYQYQSLDKNGSAVYKHTSEKGTYLYRSPLGNWLVSILLVYNYDVTTQLLEFILLNFNMINLASNVEKLLKCSIFFLQIREDR